LFESRYRTQYVRLIGRFTVVFHRLDYEAIIYLSLQSNGIVPNVADELFVKPNHARTVIPDLNLVRHVGELANACSQVLSILREGRMRIQYVKSAIAQV
jgi:hypothetical protein